MTSEAQGLFLIKEVQVVVANKWHLWILSNFFLPMIKISLEPYYYVSNSNHIESLTLPLPQTFPFHSEGASLATPAGFFPRSSLCLGEKKFCSLLSLPSHAHSKFNPLVIEKTEICYVGPVKYNDVPLYLSIFICMWAQSKRKEAAFPTNQFCLAYCLSNNV